MTVGFLKVFPVHRGSVFTGADGISYILCDGSSYPRSSFPSLSPVWPSGSYGSDDTNIHVPDLTDIEIRCWSNQGAYDPDVNSRIALSGSFPVGSGIGSYQAAEMGLHAHVDQQANLTMCGGGNDANAARNVNINSVATQNISIQGTGSLGPNDSNALVLAHTKVFYYIAAS